MRPHKSLLVVVVASLPISLKDHGKRPLGKWVRPLRTAPLEGDDDDSDNDGNNDDDEEEDQQAFQEEDIGGEEEEEGRRIRRTRY